MYWSVFERLVKCEKREECTEMDRCCAVLGMWVVLMPIHERLPRMLALLQSRIFLTLEKIIEP